MPLLSLLAKLGLDKTGFDANLDAAGRKVTQFGTHIASAFSVAAVSAFAKSIIELGSEIKDSMDRLGVGAKDVQEFGLAAKLGGQSAEVFGRAIEKIRLAMAGGKNPLAEFGITMKEMQSGDAVGVLRHLSQGLENFGGSADQTKALADVFGAKGIGPIVNMLRELPNTKDGLFFTDKDVERLDRAGDAMTKLWTSVKVGALRAFEGLGNMEHNAIDFLFGIDLKNKFGSKESGGGPRNKPIAVENLEAQAKAAEEFAKVKEKTDEQIEKNRVAQMSDEEKLNDLLSQRIELIRQLAFALTKEAEAGIQLKIAQNAADIIAAQGHIKPEKPTRFHIEESSLGRIGAFTGASAEAFFGPQHLDRLNKIYDALVRKGIVIKDVRQ